MLRPEHGDLPHQGEQTDDQRLLPEGEVADLLELEGRQVGGDGHGHGPHAEGAAEQHVQQQARHPGGADVGPVRQRQRPVDEHHGEPVRTEGFELKGKRQDGEAQGQQDRTPDPDPAAGGLQHQRVAPAAEVAVAAEALAAGSRASLSCTSGFLSVHSSSR